MQRKTNLLPKTGVAFILFNTSGSEMKFVIVIPTLQHKGVCFHFFHVYFTNNFAFMSMEHICNIQLSSLMIYCLKQFII